MCIRGFGTSSSTTRSGVFAAASLTLLFACSAAHADEGEVANSPAQRPATRAALAPSGFFTQFGVADKVTAGTLGLVWNLRSDWPSRHWNVYAEASISRWQSRGGEPSDHGVLTQVALIPVFRYRLDEGRSRWFLEGGVGPTVTSSVYRNGDTRFSTAFNFGDHLGAGFLFGERSMNEISLRVQHFSNAGIKHPNPGKNFFELRYVRRFE